MNWRFPYLDCITIENTLARQRDKLGVGDREILLATGSWLFIFRNEDTALAFFPIYPYQEDDIL